MMGRPDKLARSSARLTRRRAAVIVIAVYSAVALGAWGLFTYIRWVLDIADIEVTNNIEDGRHNQITTAFVVVMLGLCIVALVRIARRLDPVSPQRNAATGPTRPSRSKAAWGERVRHALMDTIYRVGRHREVLFAYGVAGGFALAAVLDALVAQVTPLTPPIAGIFTLCFAVAGAIVCAHILPRLYGARELPDEDELLAGADRAVREAIAKLHRANIATTHFLDGKLVRIHPDGRREDISPSLPT